MPRWAPELAGALNGAVTSFAITVAGGTLIFAPLGAEFLVHGVVAAVVAAVAGGFVAALFSSMPVAISSPRAASCIVVASLVATLHKSAPQLPGSAVIALTSLTVLTAGLLQVFAAGLRLGRLMRFVPFPVVSGFTHGVALTLFIAYVPLMLGLGEVPRVGIPAFTAWHAGAVVVGVATLAAVVLAGRIDARIPSLFVGMAVGLAIHVALAALAPGVDTGAAVSLADLPRPELPVLEWSSVPTALRDPVLPRIMLSFALALATVASVDSMVGIVAVETRYHLRTRPDRDLFAQGLGNVVAGLLGGAAVSFSPSGANAARSAQARGRWAAPLSSLLLGGLALGCAFAVPALSLALLAGLMVFIAARLADTWGITLVKTVAGKRGRVPAVVRESFLVYLLVALSIVALDVTAALAVGLIAASIVFVRTANRHVVRTIARGPALRSRREYSPSSAPLIAKGLDALAVVELEGPLFFGTADRIVDTIDSLPAAVRYVIVDLKRVQALDATAASVIARANAHLRGDRRMLLLAGRPDGMVSVEGKLPPAFPDRDRAVEWVEARLLEEAGSGLAPQALQDAEVEGLLGLSDADSERIRPHLAVRLLEAGQPVFHAGDASDELYLLVDGRISIYHEWSGTACIRVVTFMPGNLFGDVAFIDSVPRTATAVCETDCRVLTLTRQALDGLQGSDPALVARVYAALARNIAARLRAADRLLRDELGI